MTENIIMMDKQADEVLVDLFCGAGGSGGGLLAACDALGRDVRGHFVNHWDKAIDIHEANHPEHEHYPEDLFLLDPAAIFPPDTYCSLLWGSPACTFFSLARGAACVNEQDRSHAHSITDWVRHLRPEGVLIENVKEFRSWCRLMQKRNSSGELMWAIKSKEVKKLPAEHVRLSGESEEAWGARMLGLGYSRYEVPDMRYKGEYFRAWLQEMSDLGYDHDHRLLRSADYGDPTIRQRLFVYFCRRDCGKKIVWPDPLYDKHGKNGLPKWKSAREHVIDWSIRGNSIFNRKKPMASNTLRRIAIGCVRLGMKDFLLPSNKGWTANTALRSIEEPLPTLTCASRAEGLASAEISCLVPKDQGYQKDYVRSIDGPVSTVQTTAADFLAQASIVQLKGQSTAQSAEKPLTALTTCQSHYLSVPMIDVIRGTGKPDCVSKPLKALTAGGCHEALADALLMTIDQTGGGRNHGCYSVEQPTHTFPTKANASLLELSVDQIERNLVEVCEDRSLDTASVTLFLRHLIAELSAAGRPDVKPWIYVYYSNGSVGSDVEDPVPTIRTKEGTALCYPVIECDGVMLKIDILYRMLKTHELQRAMGFPDDMKWAGASNKEIVKAIGNSVSHGVAKALGLSWYSQKQNISEYV